MDAKQINPLQNLFTDIKKIISYMILKDINEANKYETIDMSHDASVWMDAIQKNDTYITYKSYWNFAMFQEIMVNVRLNDVQKWIDNPLIVPLQFQDNLLLRGREIFLSQYEEKNDYYRMLNGLPPYETDKSKYLYLSKEMAFQLHTSNEIPIHMLSILIQNEFMSTQEYTNLVINNPDKKYLLYLGMYKIDPFIARNAKDFEIIRYMHNRSDINPYILNQFSILYSSYREYVMVTLYNKQLEGVYENYRNFMGLLILMFTLMQISNKAVESISNQRYLDDSIMHTILSMYNIPDSLLLTNNVRRELVINMMKLVREKGTDDVYYDLIKILGYQDIIVSKLMLMKGQQFNSEGQSISSIGDNLNSLNDIENNSIKVDPYFIKVDLKDKFQYDTISNGKNIFSYHDITDPDPTWWDLPDTRSILENSNYTLSDSKYIMIEAIIHQIQYIFELIYFTRLILDNKSHTDNFLINIPEIFGTESISIYDLMVFIICATCMNNGLSGEIITEESKLIATAGFNFDIDLDLFIEYLDTTRYVDKDRIKSFIDNLSMNNKSDIGRLFNDTIYPMREWLELKINSTFNRKEYIEYESIYRALYTYDVTKNHILEDFKFPLEIIKNKYNITNDELEEFQYFYPRTLSGSAVDINSYESSRYKYPFLDSNNIVNWYMHIIIDTPYGEDDRGYLYFHDILNSSDLRELTNSNGLRIFMDYKDADIGWEINNKAVEKAIYLINQLDDDMLYNAYFQVETPILNSNGKRFVAGQKLSSNIKSLYKQILLDKLTMDMEGLSNPPKTYQEYLYRKNINLYNVLMKDDRFHLNKDAWLDDITRIIVALENELDMHMRYFEQSVVGNELFFKPLIILIKHFKSAFVDFARTGLKYIMADKIDIGGNSNMFKLFDEVDFIIHFVTLAKSGFESQFGLYDTEHVIRHHIILNDKSKLFRMKLPEMDREKKSFMGSMHLIDNMHIFKNGTLIDIPKRVIDYDTSMQQEVFMDIDGWKDHVESYNQY